MQAKTRLTSKGQVTIPQEVRARMGLRAGDEIEFVEDASGFRVRKRVVTSPFEKYRGYLHDLVGRHPDDIIEDLRGR